MALLRSIEELAKIDGPVVLAAGVFDGVHRGHQALLAQALSDADRQGGTAIALTFEPHPIKILRPDKAPRLLSSLSQKEALLRGFGMEDLLVLHFDAALARMSAGHFLDQLLKATPHLCEICVGSEWSFGHNREGNIDFLRAYGEREGFRVVSIPSVCVEGFPVSSTRIRKALEKGDLKTAEDCLGHPYEIWGSIQHGAGLGAKLGFPTANFGVKEIQLPPDGVYAVEAYKVRQKENILKGVANIGVRPTVSTKGERLLEVHFLDTQGDFYGEEFAVRFVGFMRKEQRFDGVEALKTQIAEDIKMRREMKTGEQKRF